MPALFQIKIVILFVPTPFFRSIYLCLWERLLFGVCWCFASRRPPRRRWPPAHTTPLPSSFAPPPPPKKKIKEKRMGYLRHLPLGWQKKKPCWEEKGCQVPMILVSCSFFFRNVEWRTTDHQDFHLLFRLLLHFALFIFRPVSVVVGSLVD